MDRVVVSNADRVVFPQVGVTKGDVVAYYERIAPRALPHVVDRPLSIQRFPKGLAAPGFFQKNVPPHYPASIRRFEVPRSAAATKLHPRKGTKRAASGEGADASADASDPNVTLYPIVATADHLAFLANQGAIELHVPTARASAVERPDRVIVDLDPPSGAFELVRQAAILVRDALAALGLASVPIATGSKGYHVVASITPSVDAETIATTMHKLGALLAAAEPVVLTNEFRIALRKKRVFVDWLRNRQGATVVAPFSLRARPKATVAVPLAWDELATTDPDAFTIGDVARLLERPDPLAAQDAHPSDAEAFVSAVGARFEAAGLAITTFDRFRS